MIQTPAIAPAIVTATTAATRCVNKRITTAQQHRQQLHSNQTSSSTTTRRRRPILYLHPGPAKTATSTIQHLLDQYQERLAADRIFLLDTDPEKNTPCTFPHPAYCLLQVKTHLLQHPSLGACRRAMKTQLAEYYRHRVDLVLTSEMLGTKFAQGPLKLKEWFRDVISIHDWDVRVWIGYRPYFAFVASGFNQQYKNQNRPKLQLWPGQGGIRIPAVANGVLEYGPENEGKHKTKSKLLVEFPFTDVLVALFQPYADRIELYDITSHSHNNTNSTLDFTEYIFCELLIGAEEACHAQRALLRTAADDAATTAGVRKNPADSRILDSDRLATAAVDRGLLNVTTTATTSCGLQRSWVGQQIRTYLANTH